MDSSKAVKKTQAEGRQFFKFDPFSTIALLLVVFFSAQLISVYIISIYPILSGWSDERASSWISSSTFAQFLFILVAEILSIFLIVKLVKYAKKSLRSIKLVKPVLSDLGWALLAYIPYMVLLVLVMTLVKSYTSIDLEQRQQIGFESAKSNIDLILTFVSLVVLVPLAEEIMFRGFLFSSLRIKYGFWMSVVVTSFIFGIAHLQLGAGAPPLWSVAIDTFLLSAILCYMVDKKNSIWPAVFLHSIKNGVAFFALFGSRIFV